jgi:hypothetical protein
MARAETNLKAKVRQHHEVILEVHVFRFLARQSINTLTPTHHFLLGQAQQSSQVIRGVAARRVSMRHTRLFCPMDRYCTFLCISDSTDRVIWWETIQLLIDIALAHSSNFDAGEGTHSANMKDSCREDMNGSHKGLLTTCCSFIAVIEAKVAEEAVRWQLTKTRTSSYLRRVAVAVAVDELFTQVHRCRVKITLTNLPVSY